LISPARNQERFLPQSSWHHCLAIRRRRLFPTSSPFLKALYILLFIFISLTFTSKDGRDRWIYGVFAIATLAVLIHYRQIPGLPYWHWRF
jgi:hypothetical protein